MENGILFIDKPYNWSSNYTMKRVKFLLNINKIGYSGTLDKLSTGILPILLNKYTKYSNYFSDSYKCYSTVIYLGISTNTYDGSGNIIFKGNINFKINKLKNIINYLLYKNYQITPIYSNNKYLRKKKTNTNLYIDIPRIIKIVYIKINFLKDNFLGIEILCSKGTYVRSLVNEIGKLLKSGAYVFSLRRIKIANFDHNNSKLLTFNKIFNFFKKKSPNNKIEYFIKKYLIN